MKRNTLFLLSALSLATNAHAAVVFNFEEGSELDTQGAGVTMSRTVGSDTVILTSIDALAPEYGANGMSTGTLSAANGGDVKTNITSSSSALGINNGSIGNTAFTTAGGPSSGVGESATFNFNESWVISFDNAVTIDEFNFSAIDADEGFNVLVEDAGSFNFVDGSANDDFSDPFSGLVIPTGKKITFKATGSLATTDLRITSITLSVVPEPSSVSLIGLAGLLLLRRRRK